MVNVNLELLRTFVVAATCRTFGEAARARGVTTSAISQQVKTLESQLGVPLFERVGRHVALTSTAARLLETVKGELASLEQALDVALQEHREVKGRVSIGGPRPFAARYLRPRVISLLASHPELELALEFDVPSALERRLAASELDLAILVRETELPGIDTAPLHVERFVAVASPALLARAGPVRSVDELLALPFAAFDRDLPLHAAYFRALLGRGAAKGPRVICHVASLDELLALAVAGVCATVLPDYFVESAVAEARLVTLDVRSSRSRAPAQNTIHLAWRTGAVESARFVAVRDALLRREPAPAAAKRSRRSR